MTERRAAILLTRSRLQSVRVATELQSHNPAIHCVISPLTELIVLPTVIPDRKWSGIVFTSENAVIAASRINIDRSITAWCVGDRTASIARIFGFDTKSADSDSVALAAMIIANNANGPILYLHGVHASDTISTLLNTAHIETVSIVCYNQIAQSLTSQAQLLLQSNATVTAPVFSARSSRLLAHACSTINVAAKLHIIAISHAAALPFNDNAVTVASKPNSAEMIKSILLHLAN